MVHGLNPKNLNINTLLFLQNPKNPILGEVFGHYPKNEHFSQKSGSASFLPLRHLNFMTSFRKIILVVLKKLR